MYNNVEYAVMSDFLGAGAWLIARGNARNPKQPLHAWYDGGLPDMQSVKSWVARGAEIGLILNTAQMTVVDLDNPMPLTDAEYKASGMERVVFNDHKKQEFRNSPQDEKDAVLQWFLDHGNAGPPHIVEMSSSGEGLHWIYKCEDADDFHFSSPSIEIFSNKKPIFITDWEALKDYHTLPAVPLKEIKAHWQPLEQQLNAITPPPRRTAPCIVLNKGEIDNYDYEKYLSYNDRAQVGRNMKLHAWVFRAAQLGDADGIAAARAWAIGVGLSLREIDATTASATRAGQASPYVAYEMAKMTKASLEKRLAERRAE